MNLKQMILLWQFNNSLPWNQRLVCRAAPPERLPSTLCAQGWGSLPASSCRRCLGRLYWIQGFLSVRRPGKTVKRAWGGNHFIRQSRPVGQRCSLAAGNLIPLPAVNSSLPYRAPSLRQIAFDVYLKDHYTTVGVDDLHHWPQSRWCDGLPNRGLCPIYL